MFVASTVTRDATMQLQTTIPQGALAIRDRYAVTAQTAAQFTGISRTRIYELLADGTIDGRIIRGRRVILVESLLRLVGEAPSAKREVAA